MAWALSAGSIINWLGAIHALQKQLGLNIHCGAITTFDLCGYAHYLALGGREVLLFARTRQGSPPGSAIIHGHRPYGWSPPACSPMARMLSQPSRSRT
ncbi:MAG: AbiEi antitoxin N-terminal domain-containing protein [Candidatus Thiodiazotropha sp.]